MKESKNTTNKKVETVKKVVQKKSEGGVSDKKSVKKTPQDKTKITLTDEKQKDGGNKITEKKVETVEKPLQKQPKIVPSYVKEKQKKQSKKYAIKSKMTFVFFGVILLAIVAAVVGITMIVNKIKYKNYYQYEDQVKTYVFDKVYNNQKANTSDSITKSEAVKMALAVTYNTSDPTGFTKEPTDDYVNARWVEFAKSKGVITEDEITKENENDKVTWIDVIRYFGNARSIILKENIDATTKPNLKDFERYTPDEQNIIADTIVNNLITINSKKLNGNKKVFKGQLNELIVRYTKKYNTVAPDGEKLNINPDKTPANASVYPYTLASIDKSVYEEKFSTADSNKLMIPTQVYEERKELYDQIRENVEEYYKNILNVDYNTIDKESFMSNLGDWTVYAVDEELVSQYIDYVKANKIILEGSAKFQSPIVYNDGVCYRARTKLEFKVKSSLTDKNLLYQDLTYDKYTPKSDVVYNSNNDTYSVYIDARLTNPNESVKKDASIYLYEKPVFQNLMKSYSEITAQSKGE